MPESFKRGVRSSDPKSDVPKPGELVQGTLEMLILKTLALEPMHGYGVALRIEQVSSDVSASIPVPCFPR